MTVEHDDRWDDVVTVGGLAADEVISTLQKSIRRSQTENAVLCAYQLWASGEELETLLWDRLHVIAAEDVGFGRPQAIVEIAALQAATRRFSRTSHDRFLLTVHAVRILSEAPKDRSSDELVSWIRHRAESGALPEVFDAALDMHTRRGREMGRDLQHFLLDGARTTRPAVRREDRWRRLLFEATGIDADEETPDPEEA